jgi:hypothetical protein
MPLSVVNNIPIFGIVILQYSDYRTTTAGSLELPAAAAQQAGSLPQAVTCPCCDAPALPPQCLCSREGGYRDWLLSECRHITLSVRAAAEVTPTRAIGQHSYTLGSITEILIKDYRALVRMSPKDVARVAA